MRSELSRYSLGRVGSRVRSRSAAVAGSALRELFTPPRTTRGQALATMERQVALYHLVSSLEYLSRPRDRSVGGLNNWEISRHEHNRFRNRLLRSVVDVVGHKPVTECLLVVNAGAALVLLAPTTGRWVRCGAATTMTATAYLLSPRNMVGGDGSDQAGFLAGALAAVARAAGSNDRVADAALWTASLQSAMSYAVSGWAKMLGSTWRDGSALEGVMRTRSYGNGHVWRLTRRFPTAARVLSATMLALECSFPLAYAGKGRLAKSYVAGTAGLHASIAGVMGLNRFLPAFTSLHPAVLYTARSRTDTIGPDGAGRSDSMVGVTAAVAAGTILTAALTQRRISRKVGAGYGDERWVYTSDGNRLAYRRRGLEGPDLPVFVLESGLQGVPESWEWIVDELGNEGTVVTYQRAGSGRSSALPNTAESVDDLVGHAVELVKEVGGNRKVVLIGHSLGGYLALRAAERSSADIEAVVLIDPSHPAATDEEQMSTASHLVTASRSVRRSIELGMGALVEMDYLSTLPPHVLDTAQTHYRDSRIWAAAEREWTAAVSDFEIHPEFRQLDIPLLVLTAQLSLERHSTVGELHRQLAALSPEGRHEVVPGTSHLSLLHNRRGARRVTRAVTRFLDASAARSGAGQVAV